jgi:type IV pilus assembly protein PilA
MIVIVIVGVLSSVALPNFLNQTKKAKATECQSQLTSQLKQVAAEYITAGKPLDALSIVVNTSAIAVTPTTMVVTALAKPDALALSSNAGSFSYQTVTPAATDKAIIITCQAWTEGSGTANILDKAKYLEAKADNALEGGGMFGCVNLETGDLRISKALRTAGSSVTVDKDVSNSDGTNAATTICGQPVAVVTATTI